VYCLFSINTVLNFNIRNEEIAMTPARKDPLLTFTLVVTRGIMILLVLAAVATVVAAALIAFDMTTGSTELGSEYPNVDLDAFKAQLWMLLPTALIGIGLAAMFMHLLTQIVKSVGEGNPFLAINARRLRNMGWLALGFALIGYPVRFFEARLEVISGEVSRFDVDIAGFVLALTLFVLARVFAHGAAMRDDLEGTV
jgi:hypothetical protein